MSEFFHRLPLPLRSTLPIYKISVNPCYYCHQVISQYFISIYYIHNEAIWSYKLIILFVLRTKIVYFSSLNPFASVGSYLNLLYVVWQHQVLKIFNAWLSSAGVTENWTFVFNVRMFVHVRRTFEHANMDLRKKLKNIRTLNMRTFEY